MVPNGHHSRRSWQPLHRRSTQPQNSPCKCNHRRNRNHRRHRHHRPTRWLLPRRRNTRDRGLPRQTSSSLNRQQRKPPHRRRRQPPTSPSKHQNRHHKNNHRPKPLKQATKARFPSEIIEAEGPGAGTHPFYPPSFGQRPQARVRGRVDCSSRQVVRRRLSQNEIATRDKSSDDARAKRPRATSRPTTPEPNTQFRKCPNLNAFHFRAPGMERVSPSCSYHLHLSTVILNSIQDLERIRRTSIPFITST